MSGVAQLSVTLPFGFTARQRISGAGKIGGVITTIVIVFHDIAGAGQKSSWAFIMKLYTFEVTPHPVLVFICEHVVCQLKFILTLFMPIAGGGGFNVAHGGFKQPFDVLVCSDASQD